MCGISFILDKNGKLDEEPIKRMLASLTHRGPDSSSFFHHQSKTSQLFFAANRLKISEKSDFADQPFFSQDQSSVLLFNGEIYNFFDLKNRLLERGLSFSSQSDTEVLLYWIKTFGADGIKDLNGMFSFLYCDLTTNELLAARDRFGMKPFYYFRNSDFVILCSEIKGIFSTGLVEKQLHEEQISHYFTFRYPAPSSTFFKNIFPLTKGHFLKISDRESKLGCYYSSPEDNAGDSFYDISEFKEKFRNSLLRQLYAEHDIGLLLSGGLDSSLIFSMAREEGFDIPCYSIFGDENSAEKKLALRLTHSTSLRHEIVEVGPGILKDFEEYVAILDQPIADSAGLLTYKICREASQNVKILLSGAGADELFAGYNRHRAYAFYLQHSQYLLTVKNLLWPLLNKVKGLKSGALNFFFENIDKEKKLTFLRFVSAHHARLRSEYGNYVDDQRKDHMAWALNFDRNIYLPEDVLMISDIASMKASTEMRMPFLDNELWDMAQTCDAGFLMQNGRKWILKEMLKDYVLSSFLNQKKKGFGLPLREWLRDPGNNHLWQLFEKKNSLIFTFLDRDFFHNLLHSHQTQKGNHEQELWSVLLLAYWLKQEFD